MRAQELITQLGYGQKDLNGKYLLVQKGDFSCYFRTNKPSLEDEDYHTCFIYDYEGEKGLLTFIDLLRKHIQVLVYAKGEDCKAQLLDRGFKQTNAFKEVIIDLAKESSALGKGTLDVQLYTCMMPAQEKQIIEQYSKRFVDHIKEETKKATTQSFTWFDSQYCPKEFHITFAEDDVLYAIFRKDGVPVGVSKLLLPVPEYDNPQEIQVEIEYTDVPIDEQRASLYPLLLERGYTYLCASEYSGISPVSRTFVHKESIYIMESGKDSLSWEADGRKTNPLPPTVWSAKRSE